MSNLNKTETNRGFGLYEFTDRYGSKCSLQESSIATEACIWFGVDDVNPQVQHGDAKRLGVQSDATSGWVKYPVPECVSFTNRMHLTVEQVKEILPILNKFVETGEI